MESQTKARSSKIDPSFKSKRYRDKLRTEIKGLEGLIPIDRSSLHRKLDSQTVFRLIISFFRIKMFFQVLGVNQQIKIEEEDNRDKCLQCLDGKQMLQCLDGFLLAAFTDGTIVYTTENVLQYLGFNQVDLMHRCLYGLVHPEDHADMKHVLENTFIKTHNCHDRWKQVSFICRMKCFNGTSAGYLKIHCSGSVQKADDSSAAKPNPDVLMLYCQPFMLTGSDIVEDFKQNVFWSKHDMGLNIKEFDKKSEEMIGFTDEDLAEKSFYKFVHPEDLATFAACHKTLTESIEVQTMYFRMETKDGGWVWLHSRGKVICKNSKKFSIVFTHCPVREEDSTFLQQESALRSRYGMNDLLYFIQFGSPYAPCSPDLDDQLQDDQQGTSKIGSFCTPHMGFTEDMSMTFYNSLDPCPSSWHAMTDRHSPVLPSTHVAHKITQREKQIQFQEFKRRQQIINQTVIPEYVNCSPNFQQPAINTFFQGYTCNQMPVATQSHNHCNIKTEPVGDYPDSCSNNFYPDHRASYKCPMFTNDSQSPYFHTNMGYTNYQNISPNIQIYPSHHPAGLHLQFEGYPQHNNCQTNPHYYQNVTVQSVPWIKPEISYQHDIRHSNTNRPSASIKVSMNCDYSGLAQGQQNYECPDNCRNVPQTVLNSQNTNNVIRYDIEASVHMKIVENPCRDNSCPRTQTKKSDVDLPSIGSLFEFLNDGQT